MNCSKYLFQLLTEKIAEKVKENQRKFFKMEACCQSHFLNSTFYNSMGLDLPHNTQQDETENQPILQRKMTKSSTGHNG